MRKLQIIAAEVISYFFILLFCYAAISKIADFEKFTLQISQSPILNAFTNSVSYGILAIELVVSILLIFERTRLIGLYGSFILMVLFSIYIYIILHYSESIPCSCGGILEKMDWHTHFIFNIIATCVAAIAIIWITRPSRKYILMTIFLLFIFSLLSALVLFLLYEKSEYMIQKENNFTRRFWQHPVDMDKHFTLTSDSYYFAGKTKDSLYLGNIEQPFDLYSLDTSFKKIKEYQIIPDQYDFLFRSSKLQIHTPYYYLYDGTVPIIYKGEIGKHSAKTLSYKQTFFTQLQATDNNEFVVLTYSKQKDIQSLALLLPHYNEYAIVKPELLEKIQDGIFDTDGKLLYDPDYKTVIYVYTYKNQFIVLDTSLGSKKTYKTIDDISAPDIEVIKLPDGSKKMKNPSIIVNKNAFVYKGILFIESPRKGKFENKASQNSSLIIDMYATARQQYLGSFYIPKKTGNPKTEFLITDNTLFAIIGNELIRYRFAQNIIQHFISGEAENLNKE
ncbi:MULTISPECIES: MauE/DoxX family redox-associated membrane protein [Chryseobacterium]|jgi:hypothetical protein|uniref:MauE/DoxX family redox-associated membrane protein n=1 Tax=Chryseobacterium TaxID=59732 RepID=UPI001AE48B07|nr:MULTISPECIES: MauE/DoxX family redox-associated membrane protein [Chryseobacterium]MBP1164569.1 hypothetical protein [Chryseobacterium sp. PvR013]MDR6461620.1 hypothetical protein [Chryseobacterium sediminis]